MIFCSTDIPGHGYNEGLTVLFCSRKLFGIDFFIGARVVEEREDIGILKCSYL